MDISDHLLFIPDSMSVLRDLLSKNSGRSPPKCIVLVHYQYNLWHHKRDDFYFISKLETHATVRKH